MSDKVLRETLVLILRALYMVTKGGEEMLSVYPPGRTGLMEDLSAKITELEEQHIPKTFASVHAEVGGEGVICRRIVDDLADIRMRHCLDAEVLWEACNNLNIKAKDLRRAVQHGIEEWVR